MRPSVSIVIPVWNQWELTRACLETLRPTLGPRDQVVVVDNGSADGTGGGLRRYPWIEIIVNEANRGFAAACNQGEARADRDVVVFLNNDTLLPSRWIDGLVEPFVDATVGATGPRSNFVSGSQLVSEIGYHPGDVAGMRRWARDWRDGHRGETTEINRLVGFCLAVRRVAFEAVGGFDEGFGIGGYEDDDLCTRLVQAGHRLLVAHESFVHHIGHQTFDANGLDWFAVQRENQGRYLDKHRPLASDPDAPLLSACLIVKNEEANLPRCLASLVGVVDEVVVYDTGSTDASLAVAEQAGATVVLGDWHEDFSRARNAALGYCRGRWVLSIDADEVLECDPVVLRAVLGQPALPDVLRLAICNLEGTTEDYRESVEHQAFRIFNPARAHWEGRLHEQPVTRPGQPPVRHGQIERAKFVHYGYLADVTEHLSKPQRNVRIAELEAAEATDVAADVRLVNLARSLTWVGRHQEAYERYLEAIAAAPDDERRRLPLRFAIDTLLLLQRHQEALDLIPRLKQVSEPGFSVPQFLQGQALLALGRPEEALVCFDAIERLETEEGMVYSDDVLPARRAEALAVAGRYDEAVPALLEVVRTTSQRVWNTLVAAEWNRTHDLTDVAAAVPDRKLLSVVAQSVDNPAVVVDAWLEALWARWPGHPVLLGAASRLGGWLSVPRSLEWAARLRAVGAGDRCPLRALVANPAAPPEVRVRAAAVLLGTFREAPPTGCLAAAAAAVDSAELPALLIEIDQLAPSLLPEVIGGAATTPTRCLGLAQFLASVGADDEAGAVLEQGFGHRDLAVAAAALEPQPA